MKPLGILRYYLLNKKKSVVFLLAIGLSVFLLYSVQMLIDSAMSINYRTFVLPQRFFSSITAKSKVLDDDLIKTVLSYESVDKAIPWVFQYTNFNSSIGGRIGTKVITAKQEDIELLMDTMGLKLKAGRLPDPDSDEIVLHELVAANKNKKIGDVISSDTDKNEVLRGKMTVCGILEGGCIVSFVPLEYWMAQNGVTFDDYSLGIILLPKEGRTSELENNLNALDISGLDLRTYTSVAAQTARDNQSIQMLLTMINIMVIIIVSICTGFISYIYFAQRRSEFGILGAMGYTGQQIVNRAFFEILWINGFGFAVGMLLSVFIGVILNAVSFIPRGQPLILWNPDYLIKAVCVPVFVILFSIIPVWRMLKKLDPVSIIEGMA
ncbi:MAG: ABC transporter permease [Clostridiaceae bacterium]|nr:ABC transporter permease [Clostridiaceae bacterium]